MGVVYSFLCAEHNTVLQLCSNFNHLFLDLYNPVLKIFWKMDQLVSISDFCDEFLCESSPIPVL